MKIRTKLLIIALVPIIILLFSSAMHYRASREVEMYNHRAVRADEIYKLFSDLTILTHEHYIYYELRAHEQWEATYRKTGEVIEASRKTFTLPREQKLLREVADHHKVIGYLFSQYGPHDQNGAIRARNTTWQRFADRLTSRLLQELQTVQPILARLHSSNLQQAMAMEKRQNRMGTYLLLAICLSVPGTSWLVYRSFSEPVSKLRDGIEIMAGGDLEHRINLSPDNEIGELGKAFDLMAEQRSHYEKELRHSKEVFEALYRLTQRISEPEGSLQDFALEEAVRLTGSSIGFIFFVNEDETLLTLKAWSHDVMPQCSVDAHPTVFTVAESGLFAEGMRRRHPFIVNDYAASHPGKKGLPPGHVPIVRHLNVPLLDGNRIVLLAAVSNKGTDYTDEDVAVLTLVMDTMWRVVRKKEAEQLLLEANEQLEHRVTERTIELRQSEARYRSLFANNHSVMLLLDPDSGEIMEANPAAESFYGYTAAEFRGMKIDRINCIPPDEIRTEMARAAAESRSHFLFQHRLADGAVRDVEVFSCPIVIGGRKLLFSIIHDVTDRKRLEEETIRARNEAEAANRAKSDFLATMSHEIRTPMNAIIGLGHLALETDLSGKQRDYLTMILSSAQSLLGIINDILDFSKIEAGKLTIQSIHFRLSDLLRSIIDTFSVLADTKGLKVSYRIDPKVPVLLKGDPLRLTQVISNLLNNAVKFTDRGEVVVSISLAGLQTENRMATILFSIRDTGIGMSEEQCRQLFQPFTQVDSSSTRRHGGTGLGLSICRHLVTLMGGGISVASTPGKGSTFSFTLPFGTGIGDEETIANPVAETPDRLSDLSGNCNGMNLKPSADTQRGVGGAPEEEQPGSSREKLDRTIGELRHLLQIQDMKAVQTFTQLRGLLAQSSLAPVTQAIHERISRLDYRGALGLLDNLAAALEKEGENRHD